MSRRRAVGLMAALTLAVLGGYLLATETRTVETEVRINARQLDDGRTEFALQQRDGSGWGERQLVRARYLPADVGHDRWLSSSPYTVSIEVEASEPVSQPGREAEASGDENRAAYGVEASGSVGDGRILYWHGDAGVNGQRAALTIYGTTSDSLYDEARLTFFCDHDVRSLWVSVDAGLFIAGEWNAALLDDYDGITLAAFGTIAEQRWERRGFETYDDDAQSSGSDATAFFVGALSERWVSVSLPQSRDDITATFDLQGAFDTPVQWLLLGCNRVTGAN
ncbi:MAG: hypothetical protein OXN86_09305 [Chloroflexota bacterium]|nr:hypothetical protein [Chloroflexota bacterium]